MALEFYKTHTTTQASVTSSTAYTNYLRLTVDRSGEAGSKDFYIIAHAHQTVDATNVLGKFRLRHNTTDLMENELAGQLGATGANNHGKIHNFTRKVTLTNASHTIDIDFAQQTSNASAVNLENASIICIEASANSEYAETNSTPVGTGAATTNQTALQLSITSSGTETYHYFWSGLAYAEDESNATALGIRAITDAGSIQTTENHSEFVLASNDSRWRSVGGVGRQIFTGVQTLNYTVQADGAGTSDETYTKSLSIIAIPESDFENVYTDAQGNVKTFHTGTGWSVSNADISQSVNANDHLVVGGYAVSNESPSQAGGVRLAVDGQNFDARETDDRDEDGTEYYIGYMVYGVTLTAGTSDFEIYGTSSSTSGTSEGCLIYPRLFVGEIDNSAGGTPPATRRVFNIS